MINQARLLDTFLDLVRIDSPSGEEAAIAQELVTRLRRLGLQAELDAMKNVVASLPGEGEPLLLTAHMDTVMPGHGIKPQVVDGVVHSDGTTILAADDKSGVAVVLELVQTLVERGGPHPPVEVVFTVQEESGLLGAKGLDLSRIRAKIGISFDSGDASGQIVVSAPYHDVINVVVHGKASHAGAEPEKGISAIVVAAQAITQMPLGRIDEETTANLGTINGGRAGNIVPDLVEIRGEARSRQAAKLQAQTAKMVAAFRDAAAHYDTTVDVDTERSYEGYNLTAADTMVSRLMAACRAVGVEPMLVPSGGGSDVNIYNAQGRQIVNLSTGMMDVHTTGEYVAVADMVMSAEIALQCLTMPTA